MNKNWHYIKCKASKTLSISTNEHMEIFVNKFKDGWWLILHDIGYPVSPYDWNSISVKKGYYYALTFTYQSFHLLKRPYSTDCIDYKLSTEFISRKDCIRKCSLRTGIDFCGVVPMDVEVYGGEPDVQFANNSLEKNCIENLNLSKKCLNVCPNVDCVKTYYRIVKLSETKLNKTDPQHLRIDLIPPSEPETTFIHKARIESVEFICYMASTVGLWFGLSMFSTINWIKMFFINFNPVIIMKGPNWIYSLIIKLSPKIPTKVHGFKAQKVAIFPRFHGKWKCRISLIYLVK